MTNRNILPDLYINIGKFFLKLKVFSGASLKKARYLPIEMFRDKMGGCY